MRAEVGELVAQRRQLSAQELFEAVTGVVAADGDAHGGLQNLWPAGGRGGNLARQGAGVCRCPAGGPGSAADGAVPLQEGLDLLAAESAGPQDLRFGAAPGENSRGAALWQHSEFWEHGDGVANEACTSFARSAGGSPWRLALLPVRGSSSAASRPRARGWLGMRTATVLPGTRAIASWVARQDERDRAGPDLSGERPGAGGDVGGDAIQPVQGGQENGHGVVVGTLFEGVAVHDGGAVGGERRESVLGIRGQANDATLAEGVDGALDQVADLSWCVHDGPLSPRERRCDAGGSSGRPVPPDGQSGSSAA